MITSQNKALVANPPGFVPWSYSIEVIIEVPGQEGELDMYRHGIKSQSDLEFMVQVILMKMTDIRSIKVRGSYKPSKLAKWQHHNGEVKNGKIVWEGEQS